MKTWKLGHWNHLPSQVQHICCHEYDRKHKKNIFAIGITNQSHGYDPHDAEIGKQECDFSRIAQHCFDVKVALIIEFIYGDQYISQRIQGQNYFQNGPKLSKNCKLINNHWSILRLSWSLLTYLSGSEGYK
jgi:hypothetical protein